LLLEVRHAEPVRPGRLVEDRLEVPGLCGAPVTLQVGERDALLARVVGQEPPGGREGECVLGQGGAETVGDLLGPRPQVGQQPQLLGRDAQVGAAQLEPALVDLVQGGGGRGHCRAHRPAPPVA
jgi:hypothetical protein